MPTIRDTINRVFREFNRYTGDGKPNEPTGAPLPIGDPQSGVHSPKKADLRDALGEVGDALDTGLVIIGGVVEEAEAARDAAQEAAGQAAAIAGIDGVATRPDAIEQDEDEASSERVMTALRTLQAVRAGTGDVRLDGVSEAKSDNNADMTAALADTTRRKKVLPTGNYTISGTLTATKSVQIEGDSQIGSVLSFEDLGASDDAFVVSLGATDYANVRGHAYRDFGIVPAAAGDGDVGFRVELANPVFMSSFEIERLFIGEFGGWGMVLDNSANNLDGFFVGTVRRCFITNGLRGINVGDSLNFEVLQITAGDEGENPAIYLTGVEGARQYIIREGNFTCRGGAIVLVGVDQARIENNQCEHGWFYGDGSYTGDFDAHIYVADCLQPIIRGNTSNPFANFSRTIGTGLYTNGSPTITEIADTSLLQPGQRVTSLDDLLGVGVERLIVSKTANSITLDGNAASTAVADVVVTVNFTAPASASIVLDGTTNHALIEDNDLARGRVAHIIIGSGVKNTRIGANAYYGQNPVIIDEGQGTMGVLKTPTLSNGWTAGTAPRFIKDLDGVVQITGLVSSGSGSIFTLPVGFRPAQARIFVLAQGTNTATIEVGSNGELNLITAVASTNISLDGIRFHAPLVA